jgi:hypothetical protein
MSAKDGSVNSLDTKHVAMPVIVQGVQVSVLGISKTNSILKMSQHFFNMTITKYSGRVCIDCDWLEPSFNSHGIS